MELPVGIPGMVPPYLPNQGGLSSIESVYSMVLAMANQQQALQHQMNQFVMMQEEHNTRVRSQIQFLVDQCDSNKTHDSVTTQSSHSVKQPRSINTTLDKDVNKKPISLTEYSDVTQQSDLQYSGRNGHEMSSSIKNNSQHNIGSDEVIAVSVVNQSITSNGVLSQRESDSQLNNHKDSYADRVPSGSILAELNEVSPHRQYHQNPIKRSVDDPPNNSQREDVHINQTEEHSFNTSKTISMDGSFNIDYRELVSKFKNGTKTKTTTPYNPNDSTGYFSMLF